MSLAVLSAHAVSPVLIVVTKLWIISSSQSLLRGLALLLSLFPGSPPGLAYCFAYIGLFISTELVYTLPLLLHIKLWYNDLF